MPVASTICSRELGEFQNSAIAGDEMQFEYVQSLSQNRFYRYRPAFSILSVLQIARQILEMAGFFYRFSQIQ